MKRIVITVIVTFVLSIAAAPTLGEEMAKEGTGSSKGYYIGSGQILAMEKERVQINYESFGIMVSDTGQGLFHNSVQQVLGGMHIANGTIKDAGFIVITLTNGDKAFMTYEGSGKMERPPIVKGAFTFVGGTGKVSGIQGGGEFTRYSLPPPAEGKSATFSVSKSHWKLP